MSLKNSLIAAIAATMLVSCDKKRVFDEYHSLGSSWHKDTVVSFDLPEMDTVKNYNLFVNLRSNREYPFNNLFLIVSLERPDGLTKVDTLEYLMADEDGNLLGDGFSDIKESKLFYEENFKFKKGVYKIKIRQSVRESGKINGVKELKGISDVGFRIETVK